MTSFDIHEIMKTLPHRYPFLLVDKIIETDLESRIVGVKNVTANEPFFQGHFPNNPVMPGVLQMEAMAQVAGILLNKLADRDGQIAFFTAIDKARFRRVVGPGDILHMEINFLKMRSKIAKVSAVATVEGKVVSEGELMFSIHEG